MSFKLSVLNSVVHLRYFGHVDALEVVQVIKDSDFVPKVKAYRKVIYDFSGTASLNLEMKDIKRFSIFANVESNFTEKVHIVIVLRRPSGREMAEHYRDEISAPSWHVDIVDTVDEAMALLAE